MKIIAITVGVREKLDVGYIPYMSMLDGLHGRPAPFGTRNNASAERFCSMTAEVNEEDEVDVVVLEMQRKCRDLAIKSLKKDYPESFSEDAVEERFETSTEEVFGSDDL